jgi:hypothetical protein
MVMPPPALRPSWRRITIDRGREARPIVDEEREEPDEQHLAEERRHRRFACERPLRAGERDRNDDQAFST